MTTSIGTIPVKYEDSTATPSLVVERGSATFTDLLLGTEVNPTSLTKKPIENQRAVPPRIRPAPPAKNPARGPIMLDFSAAKMAALKATWQ